MKFFIDNQKVVKELDWVTKQLRLHMNGAATAQMEEGGIKYRLNYGVAIPHIKQLAKRIPVSFELAERMWFQEIRETMLLAALIVPAEEMSVVRCNEWCELITNKDLVERTAMFLWSRLPVIKEVLPVWLNSKNKFFKATAYYTTGRMVQNGSCKQVFSNRELLDALDTMDDLFVSRALSFALRMNMRSNPKELNEVKEFIDQLNSKGNTNTKLIAEELISEMDLLNP
ncbi:MAG: DNA alkylation repair protein [Carboxylicivirga sp.]|jgi:3-methyladenine DNA glycosylase AlkD|nr:DNA alkylation repair protein [Carboxylicivirga sp.]